MTKKAFFKGGARLENTPRIDSSTSPDGQAVTVIFDNLKVAVGGSEKDSLVATQVASILIHIKDNDSSLHVKQRIRGFVSSDFGGRAVLLAQLGGTTFLVNLSPFPSTKEDKNFFQEFESTVPPGIDYQATLFLLVERDIDNKEVSVLLSVDSLDIQIEQSDVEKK